MKRKSKPTPEGRTFKCADGELIPVADARTDLSFIIQDLDIEKGVRKDPAKCVIANRVVIALGATDVRIFERTAFVAHRGADGVRRLYRYTLNAAARRIVHTVDAGDVVSVEGRMICLKAPSPGRTIEASKERSRLQRLGKLKKNGSRPNYPKRRSKPRNSTVAFHNGRMATRIINTEMRWS